MSDERLVHGDGLRHSRVVLRNMACFSLDTETNRYEMTPQAVRFGYRLRLESLRLTRIVGRFLLLCILLFGLSACTSQSSRTTVTGPGLLVARTYQVGCQMTTCPRSASGVIPAALRRPVSIPSSLVSGSGCPTTKGTPVDNPLAVGFALGRGPVKPLIANRGNTRRGIVDLGLPAIHGWRLIKIEWFVGPSYKGPFSIRAFRLHGHGSIRLGGSGGIPTSAEPLVVSTGTLPNSNRGWRAIPSGTWATAGGCYAFVVDGLVSAN